ncbi:hypothetical protein FQR65_LT17399 [Abscondita terminalis]|nr:hypothetical protein FQR65_LT17399 [Abscondita terminalis]
MMLIWYVRIQLSGNDNAPDREIGLALSVAQGIGGARVTSFSLQVMPLPEGLSEMIFAVPWVTEIPDNFYDEEALVSLLECRFCDHRY